LVAFNSGHHLSSLHHHQLNHHQLGHGHLNADQVISIPYLQQDQDGDINPNIAQSNTS
jgi:hypothetical protein